MKKSLFVIGVICSLIFTGCGLNVNFTPVPNVMGIEHSDAKEILENSGFKVVAIETDPSNILPKSYWSRVDREVKKGHVFKVNDEVSPDYKDHSPSGIAENKSVVIYYANEDYVPVVEDSDEE